MSPVEGAYDWIEQSLATIQRANWHRSPQTLSGRAGPIIFNQGRALVNFASNDYLGLTGDPRLAAAAMAAIQTYGTGSTGSRLLTGHRDVHQNLERAIATWKGTEAALVFSSGYLANLGTITALVNQRDLILADQYNHSSLINGAKLSGATMQTYQHCNLHDLAQQLQQRRSHHRRCLIVTDSIFSMDGDLCPLPEILDLADQHNSMVLIDEAHATGVLGNSGAGSVEYFGCRDRVLIQIGTLSKALGSLGGYVAGSSQLIDFLRNRAASWIYTTGLTPAAAAAALAAVEIAQQEPDRRDRLTKHRQSLQQSLQSLLATQPTQRFTAVLPSDSSILCLEVADAATVVQLGEQLQQAGCLVAAVRPPTVPISRLRITVMATHTAEHLQKLIQALSELEC